MDWFLLLVGLPVAALWMMRRTLVRAVFEARSARRDPTPSTMPAWTVGAFALAPGERPTALWSVLLADGTPAWATWTTSRRLAVGTENGTAVLRADASDVAAATVQEDPATEGLVQMTIAPGSGSVAVLTLVVDGRVAREMRRAAARA